MTETSPLELAYGIVGALGNDAKYKGKLDELAQAEQAAEEAEQRANDAIAALSKKRTETDSYVNSKKAELAAAQQQHDKSAKEAADRLQLVKDQMAEALRVQQENAAMDRRLKGIHDALTAREKNLQDQLSGIAARQAEAERGADLVKRQLAHIAQMPKQ